jgi:DNA repair protein RadD
MFDPTRYRDYQLDGIAALWQFFHDYTAPEYNPLVAMPTGSGKSWVIAGFIQSVFAYNNGHPQRVLSATHSEILIEQNVDKLRKVWHDAPVGIYSAGLKERDHLQAITFVSIQTVHAIGHVFGHIDLLIIDEAHLLSPRETTMYQKFIATLRRKNPYLRIIGLSATCYRLGLGMLTEGGIFTHVCYDLTTLEGYNKLIAQGWLAPLVAQRTNFRIDVSNVQIRAGEYVESQQEEAVNRDDITRAIVSEIVLSPSVQTRNRWLVFATGVKHADAVSDMLNSFGVPSVSYHSKLKRKERDARYEAFVEGRVRACVSMNAMTTGVDIPEIDYIPMLRHTNSASLWVQMLGRGTRPHEGKVNCLVHDFTSNTKRLGPINDPVIPTPPSKNKKKSPGQAPVKECPKCFVYAHASVRFCGGFPYATANGCGYEFPAIVRLQENSEGLPVMTTGTDSTDFDVRMHDVVSVNYVEKQGRNNKPNSMLVLYSCRDQLPIREWICFEHGGNAANRAARWWAERSKSPLPNTVTGALAVAGQLRIPKQIRVWYKPNTPFPQILDYVY